MGQRAGVWLSSLTLYAWRLEETPLTRRSAASSRT